MSLDAISFIYDAARATRVALASAITAARDTITGHITTQASGTNTLVTNKAAELSANVALTRIKSIQRGVSSFPGGVAGPVTIAIAPVNMSRAQLRIVYMAIYGAIPDVLPTLTSTGITLKTPQGSRLDISWEVTEWY